MTANAPEKEAVQQRRFSTGLPAKLSQISQAYYRYEVGRTVDSASSPSHGSGATPEHPNMALWTASR